MVAMARVNTADQLADALTKPTKTPAFRNMRDIIMANIEWGPAEYNRRVRAFGGILERADQQSGNPGIFERLAS
jgi:hypothetical protein